MPEETSQQQNQEVQGQLVIRQAGQYLATLRLTNDTTTLGRFSVHSPYLTDTAVSRRHAEVRVRPNGVVLVDTDSRNGTFLSEKPLLPNDPVPLTDGQIFRIGPYYLQYQATATAEQPPAPAEGVSTPVSASAPPSSAPVSAAATGPKSSVPAAGVQSGAAASGPAQTPAPDPSQRSEALSSSSPVVAPPPSSLSAPANGGEPATPASGGEPAAPASGGEPAAPDSAREEAARRQAAPTDASAPSPAPAPNPTPAPAPNPVPADVPPPASEANTAAATSANPVEAQAAAAQSRAAQTPSTQPGAAGEPVGNAQAQNQTGEQTAVLEGPQPADLQNNRFFDIPHDLAAIPNPQNPAPPPAESGLPRAAYPLPLSPPAVNPVDSAYMRYLPIIFHNNEFMGRYLQIMESLWEPREQRQDHIDMYFAPFTCPASFVPWLAGWLDMALDARWPEARQRRLLSRAMGLYHERGTADGLRQMIEVCTELTPHIEEDPQQPFTFRVYVRIPEDSDITPDFIEELIQTHKPAYAGYYLRTEKVSP